MFTKNLCLLPLYVSLYSWLNEKERKTLEFSVAMLNMERDA